MDKLLQAVKDYQREVMANFAHDDRQSYWRGKLNEAVAEAEATPADPSALDLGAAVRRAGLTGDDKDPA